MKKLFYWMFVAICGTLFFASCSDSDSEGESEDVISGTLYGTWYETRGYGEDEDGPWEEDCTDGTHPQFYRAFYEDGTGKCLNGSILWDYTWTRDGRNLTSRRSSSEREYFQYILKLTETELVLYAADEEEWWCEVYVRVDKEL